MPPFGTPAVAARGAGHATPRLWAGAGTSAGSGGRRQQQQHPAPRHRQQGRQRAVLAPAATFCAGTIGSAATNRRWRILAAAAATGAAADDAAGSGLPVALAGTERTSEAQVQVVLVVACLTMAMAAVHRMIFSIAAPSLQTLLNLSLPEMGLLQSAMLMGYLFGQIPSGLLADRLGGAHLAVAGLFLWSLACCCFSPSLQHSHPFMALMAARAALGLAQSCIMPAMSALAARWFPASSRSRCTSLVYSAYSVGTVAGLVGTPLVAQSLGWSGTFTAFGLFGLAAATVAGLNLPAEHQQRRKRQKQPPHPAAAAGEHGGTSGGRKALSGETLAHLCTLCFTHSIISWSFFIMQAWIPTMLSSLKLYNLTLVGVLSALPWLATALVAVLAGSVADWLQARHGWSTLRVRQTMQLLASGGTALSLLPLAMPGMHLSPVASVAALTAAVAWQGCTYAGFHSYVGDVAELPGFVLGITNTCGTLLGIFGNILTGWLASSAWGYAGVFAVTVLLQVVSSAVWLMGAHGRMLKLSG